jgi:hypothetical protein
MRIVTYWADGGLPPPGHWNMIATESFVEQNFSEVRWARNMALLNIAMMDAAISCWDAKYTYFNPRPSSRSFDKTTTGVPNFPVRFWTFHFFSCCKPSAISYHSI